MAAQGYRQQGSEQAVRIVFQPDREPLRVTSLVWLALLGFGALVWGVVAAQWIPLVVTLALLGLQAARQKSYEVLVDANEVRVRWRSWPLLWREERRLKTSVNRVLVEDEPWKSTYRVTLQLRDGTDTEVMHGLALDQASAEQFRQTIERALDPDEIEMLAQEHTEGLRLVNTH